jgi:ubiquitin C-terminal hydrolase
VIILYLSRVINSHVSLLVLCHIYHAMNSLNVQRLNDLMSSLNNFCESETLDDYHCQICNTARASSLGHEFYQLPPTLLIQLKRYAFSFETFQTVFVPLSSSSSQYHINSCCG